MKNKTVIYTISIIFINQGEASEKYPSVGAGRRHVFDLQHRDSVQNTHNKTSKPRTEQMATRVQVWNFESESEPPLCHCLTR